MGEEIGRKKRREADRERNLWEEKRSEMVIVRVREERKKNEEKKWESLLWERLNEQKKIFFFIGQKKIIFIGAMHCVREIVFQKKKKIWKTTYRI